MNHSILVAPDKFKGTFSAADVAGAIGRGLMAAGFEEVDLLPISDGGEGTMEALVRAAHGKIATADVTGPSGEPVVGAFGLIDEGKTAIVETAQASGLWRVPPGKRDAVEATTRGTGELIAAAIDAGAKEVIVTAGGSATTDGGRGALEALGARFKKTKADLGDLQSRLRRVKLSVAADVRNPMCGSDGAARVFGPQKGADGETVALLEQRLEDWAKLAKRATSRDPSAEPMAGAAGGLAGGLWAFAGATLRPGAVLVLDTLDFDARMRRSFAVVTGEGKLDEQTLAGKALFEVATRCRQSGVPCFAVVGTDDLDAFGRRLLDLEVAEAGSQKGSASTDDIERATRKLARNSLMQGLFTP